MTKKEIVKTISDECGLTQLKTKEIVQKTFEAIIDTLVQDPRHRIELRNFGVFEVKKRAARKARNPKTGDAVEVAEKFVVTFKPGKEMEERVLQIASTEQIGAVGDDDDTDSSDIESDSTTYPQSQSAGSHESLAGTHHSPSLASDGSS